MKRASDSLFILSIFVAALFFSQGLEAKTFRITIGSGYNVDLYPVGKKWKDEVCSNIKSRVEKETEDKIDWVFAWAGAVAKVGRRANSNRERFPEDGPGGHPGRNGQALS